MRDDLIEDAAVREFDLYERQIRELRAEVARLRAGAQAAQDLLAECDSNEDEYSSVPVGVIRGYLSATLCNDHLLGEFGGPDHRCTKPLGRHEWHQDGDGVRWLSGRAGAVADTDRERGEERQGEDRAAQASREEAAAKTLGRGPTGPDESRVAEPGPGDGSATPAPPLSLPLRALAANKAAAYWPLRPEDGFTSHPAIEIAGVMVFAYVTETGKVRVSIHCDTPDLEAFPDWAEVVPVEVLGVDRDAIAPPPALVPCCPRCLRPLAEVPDDADPSVLGLCATHGSVDSGAEQWLPEYQ